MYVVLCPGLHIIIYRDPTRHVTMHHNALMSRLDLDQISRHKSAQSHHTAHSSQTLCGRFQLSQNITTIKINPAKDHIFRMFISGHHHHHHEDHDHHDDHDPEPSSSYLPPSSHCGHSRDTGTVVNNVGDIDYQMYHVLQSVPLAIQEAR